MRPWVDDISGFDGSVMESLRKKDYRSAFFQYLDGIGAQSEGEWAALLARAECLALEEGLQCRGQGNQEQGNNGKGRAQ
uniref:Uncharacterized protein n=1 Tax=Candidatus Kentrum sp. LPFa TaxID=2126335 RepID=A0A450XNW1_9GAMM|nr:MAG: hypothetical protein BECKLPF1236A_GA0070988_1012017 [Candidatus Kentron sp. LPFa]VFK31001.1 MAG: hypothetical protein BECKLPF1236C_GA0070990_1012517 [Candidatus Kentron sp. LPFa]